MANLAFSGFYTDVHLTDGTNGLGDAIARPLYVANTNGQSVLQASTVFATGTTVGTTTTGLGGYHEAVVVINTTAVTGSPTGVVYFQVSPDSGTTWIDYATSANITAVAKQWLNFGSYKSENVAAATTDGTLAAGSLKGGPFGDRFRIKVIVTGAATDITTVITAFFK